MSLVVVMTTAAETTLISAKAGDNLVAKINAGEPAMSSVIDVKDQPFSKALRIEVTKAGEKPYFTQIITPSASQPLKAGQTVVARFWIRAEPKDGSTPEVPAFIRSTEDGFTQIAWLGTKPTASWTKHEVKAVVQADFRGETVAGNFHLGKVPQIIEIADFELVLVTDPPTTPKASARVNPLDDELVKQLGSNARLIINGNDLSTLKGPGASPDASIQLVDVVGQPFTQAVRVTAAKPTTPVWHVELTSSHTTGPIKKGDVLFGYVDIRAQSKAESGGGSFVAWLQAPKGPAGEGGGWTQLRKMGGTPGGTWSRRFFSAIASEDFATGAVNMTLHLGTVAQTVEVAGIVMWNLGDQANLDALPKSRLSYEGQAPDASWRREAMERIERHRKADLVVKVLDAQGNPVSGATVDIQLRKHAFVFGTFIENDSPVLDDDEASDNYRHIVLKYFNSVTCPTYAAQNWGWANPIIRQRYATLMKWARDNGLRTKAHPVIWSRFDFSPDAWVMLKENPSALRQATIDHARDVMSLAEAHGVEFADVINEPIGFRQFDDIIRDDNLRADWFKAARAAAPTVSLGINEHTIISAGGHNIAKQDEYKHIIVDLLARGASVQKIGVQCHIDEDFTPPEKIWAVLDKYADLNLPIHVTEFDINTEDELTQADYLRDFFLAMLAHERVEGLTLWGFWEGKMWIPNAALYRKDFSPKPSGKAFEALMTTTLNTAVRARADNAGMVKTRGFLGEYEITVTLPGHASPISKTFTLSRDGRVVEIRP